MGPMDFAAKGRSGSFQDILENLKLTSDQWDQVRPLARQRLLQMVDLWARQMKLRIELAGLGWETNIDQQRNTLRLMCALVENIAWGNVACP